MDAVAPLNPPCEDEDWTVDDAARLYRTGSWGDPFFFVNADGHVAVRPAEGEPTMDLAVIVEELKRRGVQFPVLIRFQDILRTQVERLHGAFASAIEEYGYGNAYQALYPIKVNQLHEVVDELLDAGARFRLGLECGSKAELIAALPQVGGETLLICNGVKDREMLALMLAGQRLGQRVIPVVERFAEFVDLDDLARAEKVEPILGVRIKLAAAGSGRWSESSGVNSKFGLTMTELLRIVDRLDASGGKARLRLLHCHLGSQIADIQALRQAAKEAAQVYSALIQRGVGVEYLDLGGGLGVNYDKDHLEEDAGINYSLQEYANAIVNTVKTICDANDVPVPVIITESGRALTAHHSVLIVPVLGAQLKDDPHATGTAAGADESVRALDSLVGSVSGMQTSGELVEAYHDAHERLEQAHTLFSLGLVDLEQRALAESLYWRACATVLAELERRGERSIPEFAELEVQLTDHYLCDFSVFQSMLDHWAIGQPFPIMPIARLDERPTRRGLLVDLTCDSDGKVSHYVSDLPDKRFLPLHGLEPNRPYYLGFFLMGAYEDIVGDSHNLFGRVSEAHVYADAEEPAGFWIEKIIPGTAVQDMLAQVQYFPNDLHRRMSDLVRAKIQAGTVRPTVGMDILDQYMACFPQNTYCTPTDPDQPS
jgi:arginine decarboxylase